MTGPTGRRERGMKFKSKPVVIEATQWFKNGDHPEDKCEMIKSNLIDFLSEGKVVRYFRHPGVSGDSSCISSIPCDKKMHEHGWIDTPEGGHNVCPGDWIITGILGERYPCKDVVFRQKYEPAD